MYLLYARRFRSRRRAWLSRLRSKTIEDSGCFFALEHIGRHAMAPAGLLANRFRRSLVLPTPGRARLGPSREAADIRRAGKPYFFLGTALGVAFAILLTFPFKPATTSDRSFGSESRRTKANAEPSDADRYSMSTSIRFSKVLVKYQARVYQIALGAP